MLLYIDGIDRTGKTTLAHQLQADLLTRGIPALYVHRGPPGETPTLVHHGKHLVDYQVDDSWILDRNHWSDTAYGPIYRGDANVLSPLGRLYLDLVLEARGAVAILGRADVKTVVERMQQYGEDFLQVEHVWDVHEAFEVISLNSRLPLVVWEYGDAGAEEQSATRRRILELAEERACEVRLPLSIAPEAVGYTTLPTHLLVGDTVAGSDQYAAWEFRLPFAPVPNTSGAYLWEHLYSHVTAGEMRPLLVNSTDSHGRRTPVTALWEAVGRPPLVALGDVADKLLTASQVEHGVVPHPQYVRRFKHRHGSAYAEALMRAAESKGDLRPWIASL